MIKLPDNKTFTVYEDKWVNGNNSDDATGGTDFGSSSLFNDRENSCCVGHFLRDCGVNLEHLKNVGYASSKRCTEIGVPGDWDETIVANNIYQNNDDRTITLEDRKLLLQNAFKKAFDIDLVFQPTSPKEM